MRVEIWSDIACPWCYVGKARFEKGLAGFAHRDEVEVVYRSFELDAGSPRAATPLLPLLAAKYGLTEEQARQAELRTAQNARDEGLEYRTEGRDHGNTFDMHRLLHLAAKHDRQDELLTLLYRANFADERSAFEPARLLELGVAAGLDEREVSAVLADESLFAAQVRADEREAAELGATGVPFFVFDRRIGVSGAQQAETFTRALEQAWSARSPLVTVAAEDAESCGPDGC